jgi:hypothetical protein
VCQLRQSQELVNRLLNHEHLQVVPASHNWSPPLQLSLCTLRCLMYHHQHQHSSHLHHSQLQPLLARYQLAPHNQLLQIQANNQQQHHHQSLLDKQQRQLQHSQLQQHHNQQLQHHNQQLQHHNQQLQHHNQQLQHHSHSQEQQQPKLNLVPSHNHHSTGQQHHSQSATLHSHNHHQLPPHHSPAQAHLFLLAQRSPVQQHNHNLLLEQQQQHNLAPRLRHRQHLSLKQHNQVQQQQRRQPDPRSNPEHPFNHNLAQQCHNRLAVCQQWRPQACHCRLSAMIETGNAPAGAAQKCRRTLVNHHV